MVITLINCNTKLQAKGINLYTQNGMETLNANFQTLLSLFNDWSYGFYDDIITINVSDGTIIPIGLSDYGDVIPS